MGEQIATTLNTNPNPAPVAEVPKAPSVEVKFPYTGDDQKRLSRYQYYEQLFLGEHYDAFRMRISSVEYNRAYSMLRYVMVNFAGLISKVVADMLFSEPIGLSMPEGGDQAFVEALWRENKLDVQLYESALSNSYSGDAVFKVRLDKRHPNDEKPTIIIEDITPRIYFPKVDAFNVRGTPTVQELAWLFNRGNDKYLRQEIHTPGKVETKVFRMDNDKIGAPQDISILGIPDLKDVAESKIDRSLVVHVPNWKIGNRYFGISDYYDLDPLFYAVNNRMTMIDNILDKHSDPILMVPPGVIDENGKVKKKTLGVIEVDVNEGGKPEYIVWDASLENAFKEVEKLVEFIYLIGEISPDILGVGKGVSDSGRALKFKLMRTIAKTARKKLYYDRAIKEVLYVAQLLAEANNVEVDGLKLTKKPTVPELNWSDGLPVDETEQMDIETKAIDAGLTSPKDAIMRIYGYDKDTAEEKAKEAKDSMAIPLPTMNISGKPNGAPVVPPKPPVVA